MTQIETSEAEQFYERVKAGERIELDGNTAADELMTLGLIETQALVWETRVCYVLTGTDPRRDAVVRVLADHASDDMSFVDELADKILAVLK